MSGLYGNIYKLHNLFLVLCVAVMLVCDTVAFATVDLFGFRFSASGIIFPIDFLLLGVVTNGYGYKAAGRIVWFMILSQLIFVLFVNLISVLGRNIQNPTQGAYFLLYQHMWRLIFSSSTAILASYFLNDFLVSIFKVRTKFLEQKTVIRILIGAAVSQALLVSIAYPINFYGIYSFREIVHIAFNTWAYKMVCVFALMPVVAVLVLVIKRVDNADIYDRDISYNPFFVFSSNETPTSARVAKEHTKNTTAH